MPRAVVVEDQLKLRRNLQVPPVREGFDVETWGAVEDGFYRATTGNFDIVILDLMPPVRDGLQVLADLRLEASRRRCSS